MEKLRYILLIGIFFTFGMISAQSLEELPLTSIIPLEGYSADVLLHNADSYFTAGISKKKKKSIVEVSRKDNSISIPKETIIYSRSVAKHPLGKLSYTYAVDVKDNKYRYTFSDMSYIPYERNRYGKFVPVSGKNYSIESIINNPKFRYRKDILTFLNKFIEKETSNLYQRMSEVPQAENSQNNEKNEDW